MREVKWTCRCPRCGHEIESEATPTPEGWTPRQNVEGLVGLAIVILGSAGLGGWVVAVCLGGGGS